MIRSMKSLALGVIVAAAMVAAATMPTHAQAANTTFFTSLGDMVFPFKAPTNNPTAAPGTIDNMTIGATTPAIGSFTDVLGSLGTYKKNPAPTGGTGYYYANYQRQMLFENAGTITTTYTYTAPAPIDGAEECMFTTNTITNFYFIATSPQKVNNGITTLAALAHACYLYSASNATWDREE